MELTQEITALVDSYLARHSDSHLSRKDICSHLDIARSRLSQWENAGDISELQLSRLVDLLVEGSTHEKEETLLRLLLLLVRQQADKEQQSSNDEDAKQQRMSETASTLLRSASDLGIGLLSTAQKSGAKVKGRTLEDFPESFYPLVIVTGDKREDSASRITLGDFGAVSAS